MAAYQYYGKIEHTEKTIMALYRTQYHVYSKPQMLLWMGFGFVLIFVAAFATIPTWAKTVLLLIGALVVTGMDFPSQVRADRAVDARHGSLPRMEYEFHKDAMRISGEGSMSIPYKKIERLVDDKSYLYFFMGKDSVCMVDRATIKPKSVEEFKEFISGKTGLHWQSEKSFLTMNLADVLLIFNNKKEANESKKKKR
ncbi:MAG: YcxB family protein [Oscillospiraceae bacterium]|nr:YcxB family protein [Oscillospiraceae bacterium]